MEWRLCPLFPDYEVSEAGDLRRLTPGRGAKVGAILKPFVRDDGYPMYMPRRNGETLHAKAHQLVASAFLEPKPFDGAEIAHNDGNPGHNHWTNLRWDSRSGNHADKVKHGTHSKGERHPGHKLTAADVGEMRRRYRAGMIDMSELAKQYGVAVPAAMRAITGKTWGHVHGPVSARSRGHKGAANPKAKLTGDAVRSMRARFERGETITAISAAFGLGYEQARRVIRGEYWAHVPGAIAA